MKFARYHSGLASSNSKNEIYVIGGFDQNGSSNKFEVFDLFNKNWLTFPEMNQRRGRLGSGVCLNDENDKFFVAGGFNNNRGDLSSVEMFDFKQKKWTNLPSMNKKRRDCGLQFVNNKLFVIGGRYETLGLGLRGRNFIYSDFETLDLINFQIKKWRSNSKKMSKARDRFGIVKTNDGSQIIVIAGVGVDDGFLNCIYDSESLNTRTLSWTKFKISSAPTQIPPHTLSTSSPVNFEGYCRAQMSKCGNLIFVFIEKNFLAINLKTKKWEILINQTCLLEFLYNNRYFCHCFGLLEL